MTCRDRCLKIQQFLTAFLLRKPGPRHAQAKRGARTGVRYCSVQVKSFECHTPLISCLKRTYTFAPLAGMVTDSDVALVRPEKYRLSEPTPVVPTSSS